MLLQNVMVVIYFDFFKVVVVYSGVFYFCFYIGIVNGWNFDCVNGFVDKIFEEWVQVVFDVYFGYEGVCLCMRIYYGSVDDILVLENYREIID